MKFVPPEFCYEGQVVYVRQCGNWIKAVVSVAAGDMARVVNEVRGIAKWSSLRALRIELLGNAK